MKRVAIIGSSIAGASLALLLGGHAQVTVYEMGSKKNIGDKLCSNICTNAIKPILKKWGLDPKKFIQRTFTKQRILTREKSIEFQIKEHEMDRKKLLDTLILKAQKKGVKFKFDTKLVDFGEGIGEKGFDLVFEKNGKRMFFRTDVIIGADGALSEVAKKAGLWNNRKHFLYLQSKLKKSDINKKFAPGKNTQYVFVGGKFGYYSYVYPSGQGYSIGLGESVDKNVKNSFKEYVKFVGAKNVKLRGALIPLPKVIGMKKNLFVIGDAACHTKFSLGGIIPSMMAAEAVRDILLRGDYSAYFVLKLRILLHQTATHILHKLDEADFEELFEIMEDPKYGGLMAARDKLGLKELGILLSPKLIWFSLRKLFK
ncbi:FAD-dependent monooxygenase [Nanoarchaeota archaeon]